MTTIIARCLSGAPPTLLTARALRKTTTLKVSTRFGTTFCKRHPNIDIDNANWRITGPDLEVTKRSIDCRTRTELDGYEYFPEVNQSQTMELSLWLPLHASLLNAVDPYRVRSVATTGVGIGLDLLSPYIPEEQLRKAVAEIKQDRPYWLGDFYPLAGTNAQDKEWCVVAISPERP